VNRIIKYSFGKRDSKLAFKRERERERERERKKLK